MAPEFPEPFALHYDCLLKRLKLHGLQPKRSRFTVMVCDVPERISPIELTR